MSAAKLTAESVTLTPAEMAVVFQHMLGPAVAEGGLLGDLNLQPPALEAARARLLERGLLRPAPDRSSPQTFIAPGARALFGAVTRPLMLGVLQIMRTGQAERGAYFSWTPDLLVFNTVDARGQHRLEPLPNLDAVAERALAECELDRFAPQAGPLPPTPDAMGQAASLRAIFMTVASARTAHEQVHGLAWLLSAGRLWLMAPGAATAPAPGPAPRRAGPAPTRTPPASAGLRVLRPDELRAAILAAAQQAVDHTRAVLETAAA
jgi:hypothetical protein